MISGDAGCGKSSLISHMAYGLATGTGCLGRALLRSAECLYLDRENGISVVQERFRRLNIMDGDNFHYWADNGTEVPIPDDPRILRWVKSSAARKVIFVDSLIAFFDGKENDPGDIRAFMNKLRKLANLGVAVVILHHTGKSENTKEYRGSSDIKAAIDVGFTLTNKGRGRLTHLDLTAFKCRFTVAEAVSFIYEDGKFVLKADASTVESTLFEIVRSHPAITKSELEHLAEQEKIPRKTVREFVEKAVSEGRITIDHGPRNSMRMSIVEGSTESLK